MNLVQKKISINLKKYREAKNISQAELAKLLNMNVGSVSSYEQGRATPSLEVLVKMAYILCCSIDELLELPTQKKDVDEIKKAKKDIINSFIEQLKNELTKFDDEIPPEIGIQMNLFDIMDTYQKEEWEAFVYGKKNV